MLTDIDNVCTVNGVTDHGKVCKIYDAIKLLAGDKADLGQVPTHHTNEDGTMMFFYNTKDYREASQRGWDAVAQMPTDEKQYPGLVLSAYINAMDSYLFEHTYTEDPFQYDPEVFALRKMHKD